MVNYKGHNVEVLTQVKKAAIDKATEPYDGLSQGPFRTSFDKMEGVYRKEVVNYSVRNGYLFKETAIRTFSDGDYHDTVNVETLHKIG
jgi:hypothetical protein